MGSILDKLDSYQILTNLLPGAFFGLALKFLIGVSIPTASSGEEVVVYYFMGLVINRVGSLVVEPVLKWCGFIRYTPYSDYAKATKVDSKIDTLSEMNNYTRSLLTSTMLLLVGRMMLVWPMKWTWIFSNWEWVAIVLLVLLFLFAYRKQTQYVCKRVEAVNSQKQVMGSGTK